MPAARKRTTTTRKGTKSTISHKPRSISKKTRPHSKTSTRPHAPSNTRKQKPIIGETYVFECTHPGCGYKLWHDEKHTPGQVRLDWKCAKCHHYGFKCLGKSEVPEKFEIPITDSLDLNSINPSQLDNSTSA